MRFFESQHCQSRQHCATCRNYYDGKAFRASILKTFEDITEQDFFCPFGQVWNVHRELVEPSEPSKAIKKRRPCKGCRKRRKDFRERLQNNTEIQIEINNI